MNKTAPKVGFIFLVGRKLLIDSTPLAKAGSYGDSAIHEKLCFPLANELLELLRSQGGAE